MQIDNFKWKKLATIVSVQKSIKIQLNERTLEISLSDVIIKRLLDVRTKTNFTVECIINSFIFFSGSNPKNPALNSREIKGINNASDNEIGFSAQIYLYL